jgi:hypothetical protein
MRLFTNEIDETSATYQMGEMQMDVIWISRVKFYYEGRTHI